MYRMNNQVETRSSTYGLASYTTVKDAYIAFLKDKTLWRISFHDKEGEHRWVTKFKNEPMRWVDENLLCSLSKEYDSADINSNQLFWVDHLPNPIIDKYSGNIIRFPVKGILTDEQFREKYIL